MDMNASAGEVEEQDTEVRQGMPVEVRQDTRVGQLVHPTQTVCILVVITPLCGALLSSRVGC